MTTYRLSAGSQAAIANVLKGLAPLHPCATCGRSLAQPSSDLCDWCASFGEGPHEAERALRFLRVALAAPIHEAGHPCHCSGDPDNLEHPCNCSVETGRCHVRPYFEIPLEWDFSDSSYEYELGNTRIALAMAACGHPFNHHTDELGGRHCDDCGGYCGDRCKVGDWTLVE